MKKLKLRWGKRAMRYKNKIRKENDNRWIKSVGWKKNHKDGTIYIGKKGGISLIDMIGGRDDGSYDE